MNSSAPSFLRRAGEDRRVLKHCLADNPRPEGALKMEGAETYRVRVRDYRIIYEIVDRELLVLVVKIGHRRDVYK